MFLRTDRRPTIMADTIKNWEKMRQALQLSGAELRELAQHFRKSAEDALPFGAAHLSGLADGTGNGDLPGPGFRRHERPGFAHPPHGRTGLCRRKQGGQTLEMR